MKKLWITILTTLLVVALGIVLLVTFTHKKQDSQATSGSEFANKQVPTLFYMAMRAVLILKNIWFKELKHKGFLKALSLRLFQETVM